MGSAVVIGASVAGLTAAKVLSQRFDQVTVVERDVLPESGPRKGVPQSHHPHVLLAAGLRALDQLMPGLSDDMADAGAVRFEPGTDLSIHRFGGLWRQVDLGLQLISFSRPLLDSLLLKRTKALSNVTIREGVSVSGLTGDASRVTGVVLDTGETLAGDLVVDASGRSGRSDRWLGALGCAVPTTAEVKIGVGYTSQFVRREPGFLPQGKAALIMPELPSRRAGVILPVEGDRWQISMGGWHGDYPRTGADLRGFAAELPLPWIHEKLTTAEPVGEAVTMTFPSSKRRYFEKLNQVPAGYVASGDAVCSFNPIYGQGMTCAALDAITLGRVLARYGTATSEMARAYFREVGNTLATPWRFAVGGDFVFPETTGPRPRGIRLLNGYSRRIQLASKVDPVVRKTFTSVQHLLEPPDVLFKPAMVLRVLRAANGSGPRS